jgi:hypothetical protein
LAAVTEGGTGNSGVERPEPSPHFSETVAFLRAFNRWRRGDETLEQPCPQKIGEAIDAACDEIERLQAGGCARDQRTTQFCAEAVSAIQERDELRYTARKLIGLLEIEEESDGGNVFYPNRISSCRVMDGARISQCLKKLKKLSQQ